MNISQTVVLLQLIHVLHTCIRLLAITSVFVISENVKELLHKQTLKFWSDYRAYLLFVAMFLGAASTFQLSESVHHTVCFFSVSRHMDHSSIKVPRSRV